MSYNPYFQPPQHSPQGSGAPYSGRPYPASGQVPPYGAMNGMGFPPGPNDPNPNPAINEPWYGIGFWEATKRSFSKAFRFKGFASRSEFWWAYLSLSIIQMLITFVGMAVGFLMILPALAAADDQYRSEALLAGSMVGVMALVVIVILISYALVFPSISLTIRRLHDAGYSGWFYLLFLVPAGTYVVLFLCILETNQSKWRPEWVDTKP